MLQNFWKWVTTHPMWAGVMGAVLATWLLAALGKISIDLAVHWHRMLIAAAVLILGIAMGRDAYRATSGRLFGAAMTLVIIGAAFGGTGIQMWLSSRGLQPRPIGATVGPKGLQTGDCVRAPELHKEVEPPAIYVIASCTDSHDGEVYFSGTASWPPDRKDLNDEALGKVQSDKCRSEFEAYVGIPIDGSILHAATFGPDVEMFRRGERHMVCIAFHSHRSMNYSVKGLHS